MNAILSSSRPQVRINQSVLGKSILQKLNSYVILTLSIILFLCIPANAVDKDKIIFLNNTGNPDGSFVYSVMQGENLYIPFTIDSTVLGKNIRFYLTTFTGEEGDNITVVPGLLEIPELKQQGNSLTIKVTEPVLTLELDVPELPTMAKYIGSIVVLSENQILQTLPIILKRATIQLSAQLSVDLKSITINHTRSFFGINGEAATFTLPIRNASHDWQAKGIYLRLLEVTTPEGVNFNTDDNLIIKWNGRDFDYVWRSPLMPGDSSTERNIMPNQQEELSGEFLNLSPGKYSIKIGIAAANGNPEKEQQIVFDIEVRDNYLCAIFILLLAIAISFIANKFLDTQYSRSALLKRIEGVRPPWLREGENTLPVVSVRTILKQAEARNKNIFTALFSSTDVVGSQIDKAEKMISVLSHIRQIREKISSWNVDKMISYRAEKRLKKIISEMGWESGDDKFIKELEVRLETLDKWFIPDQLYNLYWIDLKEDVENLLAQAKPEEFVKEHQDVIRKLHQKIFLQLNQLNSEKKENEEKRHEVIINIGHDYARLKILWESTINNDHIAENELFKMFNKEKTDSVPAIKEFWLKADNIIWNKLVEAADNESKSQIEFTSPIINNIQPLYAHQLIHFNISPVPPTLGNNYLFHHGLDFQWFLFQEIENERKILTKPVTKGPELVQYIPVKGKFKVAVQMIRNGSRTKEILMKDELEIKSSEDFGWRGIFRSAEITALVLAVLFAIVSGLSSFYFNNTIFGTVKDYITLFIWGAGVDLGKNFIQKLQQSTGGKQTAG